MNKKMRILKVLLIMIISTLLIILGADKSAFANEENETNETDELVNEITENKYKEKDKSIYEDSKKAKAKSIKNLEIQVNHEKYYTYTGEPITVSVKLFDGYKKLRYNKDYTLEFSKNINPGKAKIVIKGIGKYKGTVKEYFYIAHKSIKNVDIQVNNSNYRTYTGEPITVSVKLFDGERKLRCNKDYTLEFSDNQYPGKAKIIIKGIGKYTGTAKKSFYIAPKKAVINSVSFNSSFTNATIEWEKDYTATGYNIYMSETKDGEYVKIKNVKNNDTNKYTKNWLDPNKAYYFKVQAYFKVGKKQIANKFSSAKSGTGLVSSVTLTSYSSGYNRNYNLNKACQTISGLTLNPGESFNWFNVVGRASAAKGYKQAIIYQGTQSVLGYGGGVCQVSSTLYQAARNMGMEIVERHMHNKPVSYTTWGNDATVYYGVDNLIIRNNKGYKVKIVMYANGGSTTCDIYRVL